MPSFLGCTSKSLCAPRGCITTCGIVPSSNRAIRASRYALRREMQYRALATGAARPPSEEAFSGVRPFGTSGFGKATPVSAKARSLEQYQHAGAVSISISINPRGRAGMRSEVGSARGIGRGGTRNRRRSGCDSRWSRQGKISATLMEFVASKSPFGVTVGLGGLRWGSCLRPSSRGRGWLDSPHTSDRQRQE